MAGATDLFSTAPPSGDDSARFRVGDRLAVWLSFLTYSAVAAPVPALNEPHYLAKAKHFWQPAWCAGDAFLESTDAHTVFFATLGWFTTWCSLPVAAWIGRTVSLAVLAWGWTTLAERLTKHRWAGITSAWLFLTFASCGNWSGEWLVGGVESKVITYGLLFIAWAHLADQRWLTCATAMGVAIAFHPVVGLWGLLATVFAAVSLRMCSTTFACPSWFTIASALVIVTALATPGMIPVLRIVLAPVDAHTRYAATYLQVFYRLGHHLDPMVFPARAYAGYAALTALWIIGIIRGPRSPLWMWVHAITAAALLFALCGFVAGCGPRPADQMPGFKWRMHLLKFYPFRLADALIPAVVAWQTINYFMTVSPSATNSPSDHLPSPRSGVTVMTTPVEFCILTICFVSALLQAHRAAQEERYEFVHDPHWRDVCAWVKAHTPTNVLIHTPHYSWTFKWFAERPEYVTFKDCPQDPRGIVEWNRRLLWLTKRTTAFLEDGLYTRAELKSLREETGITHIVTDKLGPMELPPVYHNATYQVYDLRELDAPGSVP